MIIRIKPVEVQQQIEASDLTEITVSVAEQGVKIVTTGLLFTPESSELTPDIIRQLDEVGDIFKNYVEHQFLIETIQQLLAICNLCKFYQSNELKLLQII